MELHEEIWSAALARLKTSLDGDVYSRWIAVISPVSLRDGVLAVAVDNEMLKMWVENNYLPYILDAARIDSAERVSAIEITVDAGRTPAAQEAPEPEPAAARGRPGAGSSRTSRFGNGINPNYTFADFIIGPSNSFAHAASAAVASKIAVNAARGPWRSAAAACQPASTDHSCTKYTARSVLVGKWL